MQVYAQPENEFVQEECYKYLSSALYLSSDKIVIESIIILVFEMAFPQIPKHDPRLHKSNQICS